MTRLNLTKKVVASIAFGLLLFPAVNAADARANVPCGFTRVLPSAPDSNHNATRFFSSSLGRIKFEVRAACRLGTAYAHIDSVKLEINAYRKGCNSNNRCWHYKGDLTYSASSWCGYSGCRCVVSGKLIWYSIASGASCTAVAVSHFTLIGKQNSGNDDSHAGFACRRGTVYYLFAELRVVSTQFGQTHTDRLKLGDGRDLAARCK